MKLISVLTVITILLSLGGIINVSEQKTEMTNIIIVSSSQEIEIKRDYSEIIKNTQYDALINFNDLDGKKRQIIKSSINLISMNKPKTNFQLIQEDFEIGTFSESLNLKMSINSLSTEYNDSSPISIFDNTGFSIFPGQGTLRDPYRIEGWNITSSSGPLIDIRNTNVNFKVENNLINGLGSANRGIYLVNVSNGNITNNSVYNNGLHGINLENSYDTIIADNGVENNGYWGIYLKNSWNNLITDNSANNNFWVGIRLDDSFDNNLTSNQVINNSYTGMGNGIHLQRSQNNVVANNDAHGENANGIYLINADNNIIESNIVCNTTYVGIRLETSSNNNISKNTVYNNPERGIGVYSDSDLNNIIENVVYNNGDGIGIQENGDQNRVINNTAYNNNWSGIGLNTNSNLNDIKDNIIYENNGGISLSTDCNNNVIANNSVYESIYEGISLSQSINNIIVNNSIINSGNNGIWNEYSSNNEIINNFVNNSSGFGQIFSSFSNNVKIINNSINSGFFGIVLGSSHESFVSSNVVNTHTKYGIHLSLSNWNTVELNFVDENGGGISVFDSSSNNFVFNNTISLSKGVPNVSSGGGIGLSGNFNTISNNIIKNCDTIGIWTEPNSNNHIITNNEIFSNYQFGLSIEQSSSNLISHNLVHDNGMSGMALMSFSNNNEIFNNTFYNNNGGIGLGESSLNNITNNLFYNNNGEAINLYISSNNYISGNVLFNEYRGLSISSNSQENIVVSNDFMNEFQSLDEGSNNFFNNNYWSDWNGTGHYIIEGSISNSDQSPSINPFHLSAPEIISPTFENSLLKDNVTIKWTGCIDAFNHSISYSLYYSSDNGISWTELVSGLNAVHYTFDSNTLPEDKLITFRIDVTDSIGFVSQSIIDTKYELWTKPTVPTILYPNGGETLKETINIMWEESLDPDGLPITYSVYYSADGGATWNLISEKLTPAPLFWNTTSLPNGLSYLVKIIAINSEKMSNEDISDETFIIDNDLPKTITTKPTEISGFTMLFIIGILIFFSRINKKYRRGTK
ncbi:MAG: right-handed parallel beta-helix repeat-containing protein [Candidatus Hodarchaeales archaeon]